MLAARVEQQTARHAATAPARNGSFVAAIAAHWLFFALLITLASASVIWLETYPDPDDILRRLEVRDLLAGQSWWDVTQYRLASGMMHWSRLVDLPLAAVILPLRPLLGEVLAERVAMVVVPLVTLGATLASIAYLTRRLLDDEHAKIAMMITPIAVPLIFQMRPLRIDHHGWQVVLALVALQAVVARRPDARAGLIGGIAIAALLTISLEGLPIATALLALVALAWAFDPSRRAHLIAATSATFATAVALHLATRGPHFWAAACDAMAPVWLAVLGTAAATTALATLAGTARFPLRIAALAAGGLACGLVFLAVDPSCLRGPFGHLDPLVRELWYEKVGEGLPIWDQTLPWAVASIGLPLAGLVGAVLALRSATDTDRRTWWMLLGAQLVALILSIQVSRAAATACAFALPGAAYVVLALLRRARQLRHPMARIAATFGAFLAVAPGLVLVPLTTMARAQQQTMLDHRAQAAGRAPCESRQDPRALAALPPARLFAPLDIAPEIIAATGHHAIASGHHRNAVAMHDVIAVYTGDPDRARQLVVDRYHADYLVGCPASIETSDYEAMAPNGLWARLVRGERIGWLEPVPVPGSPVLAWRVLPKAPSRK